MAMNNIVQTLGQPAVAGISAGVISAVLGYSDQSMDLFGFNIAAPLGFAAIVGAASLIGQSTKDFVLPYFVQSNMLQGLVGFALPIVTGTAAVGVDLLVSGLDGASPVTTFGIGFGAQLIAGWFGNVSQDIQGASLFSG